MAKDNQNIAVPQRNAAKVKIQRNTSGRGVATEKKMSGQFRIQAEAINVAKREVSKVVVQTSKVINSAILVKAKQRPESKMTSREKMELARNGISKNQLEQLKKKAALSYDQLAEVFSVSRATLINKKGNAVFNQELSEKIIAIATIYSYGYEVFEDEERFNSWISRSNRALGYKAPYDLLSSSFGREEVMHVIGRSIMAYILDFSMIVYRIARTKRASDLTGEGARLNGARWNHVDTPCVYTSESRALALLEYTVNTNIDDIPRALSIITIRIPDNNIRIVSIPELPGNWKTVPPSAETKDFGTALLKSASHPVFKVPSSVLPEEFNYLLNPLHPDSSLFKIIHIEDHVYDLRIKTV